MSRYTFVLLVALVLVLLGCQPRSKYTEICATKTSPVRVADNRCPGEGLGVFRIPDRYPVPAVGSKVDLTHGSWTRPGGRS